MDHLEHPKQRRPQPPPNRPIGLGIIGCGKVARERHLPALKRLKDFRITALCDTDPRQMNSLGLEDPGRYGHYLDLIEDPRVDAVAVLTPTAAHGEPAMAVMAAGKPLFLEKPLALDLETGLCLVQKAGQVSSLTLLGFHLRWHRLVTRARAFIGSGALGDLKALHSTFTHDRTGHGAPDWHRQLNQGGGVIFNEAIHHFDLWYALTGCRVETIASFSRASDQYENAVHTLTATLSDQVSATGIFSFGTSPQSRVELLGERGRLVLDLYRFDGMEFHPRRVYPGDLKHRAKQCLSTLAQLPTALKMITRGGDFDGAFYRMWQDFSRAIRWGTPLPVTFKEGQYALATALTALESARSGRTVAVKALLPPQQEAAHD